jgi:hypothetical protein
MTLTVQAMAMVIVVAQAMARNNNKLILRLPESQDSLSVARPKTQNTLRVYIFSTFGNVR